MSTEEFYVLQESHTERQEEGFAPDNVAHGPGI